MRGVETGRSVEDASSRSDGRSSNRVHFRVAPGSSIPSLPETTISRVASVVPRTRGTAIGSGAEGSGAVDLDDLTTQLNDIGFWLTPSYWQGYSPQGPGNRPWWTGGCGWDALCGGVSGWKMTDISIVASGTI